MRMNETTIHESHYFFPCFWHQMKKLCQNVSWCFKKNLKNWHCQRMSITKKDSGVCCEPCNPSKWEAEFWGWLEVWRPAVKQRTHWACWWQYGHPGGTKGWLGVWKRAIWAAWYIQQLKALLASNNGICRWVRTV